MIFAEDGVVKVGSKVLPGVFKSIEITQEITIDEETVEGSNKSAKQVTGYDDAKVDIELILDDSSKQTKYQKLEAIQNVFQASGQSLPKVYSIANKDTAARHISKVIFKSLGHKSENQNGQLPVSIEFTTYNSMTITATATKKKTSSTSANKSGGTLTSSYNNYLTKRGKSPAVDNDNVVSNTRYITPY